MFSPSSNSSMLANGGLNNTADLDGSGTINPASLGGPVSSAFSPHLSGGQHHMPFSPPATASSEFHSDSKPRTSGLDNLSSPRGLKRSRSPDPNIGGDLGAVTTEEPVRRKRGRPPKNKSAVPPSPQLPTTPQQPQQSHLPSQQHQAPPPPPPTQPIGTPVLSHVPAPLPTPPKPTPPKPATVKALPTVRDHTTDQLTPEGDEYIPRETDEAGDKKVMATGHLLGGREYRCRTFHVPNRGDKLFMLATECARILGYRDSYLLFNKNRSLYKIIATQAEKDDLIQQELLPYSYRSRQIAIVTAKSMFRQFGSRVITNGRRVRDDYWEMKARKQGFTEDDPAGEKRPGAAKQRAAAASEQAAQQQQQAVQQQATQAATQAAEPSMYSHDSVQLEQQPQPQMVQPGLGGPAPVSLAPHLPMIHPGAQQQEHERPSKELYNVPRPRHEISGPPYVDRSTQMSMPQIMDHAHQASEFNKTLTQGRLVRKPMYDGIYKKSPPPQQITSPPLPHHSQNAPAQQHHQQMHPHPQPMMSPQQLSSLNHQQPAPQHHQPQQPLHPMGSMMHASPVRPQHSQSSANSGLQGIKPEQLQAHPSAGNYGMPQYFNQQPAQSLPQPPPHTPQHQQGRHMVSQSHPQSMPAMHQHQNHPQQQQMYPPNTPQQFLQQQQQQGGYQAHNSPYRQPPPPQQPQQQWWAGSGGA
ncbi:chromatin remodelling complex Rsc7/Swp82 subunit-domain-containing protein [Pyronema domesticum]|uniref:Similar to Chromatin structure-remodeling complex subunit rsc7 acc. no. O94522 n=1 Tax=Pyronema omphalodes (strain CBS 100304) TaxID=1076935 RepID=U4LQC3_PYROM|nr:chromatin remodelling complex Rsc7/Swp82 subunit-domain-containing protein [Pyronema domesticum]CCX34155.1 Similar to Chromatin structure-remodeling complex subunit rsc7; acc. no. O94522 [Pyronema omphalodes CBS 100304]